MAAGENSIAIQVRLQVMVLYAIIISQAFISKHLINYYDNYNNKDTLCRNYTASR
jgi:hypothetical protein